MFLLYWTKFLSVGSSVVKYDFDENMLQPPNSSHISCLSVKQDVVKCFL